MRPNGITRFWSFVDKNGPVPEHAPELGPCWLWTGGHTGHPDPRFRYGRFMLDGRRWKAHRLASALVGQPIPDNLHGCHRCDLGLCVRPGHVFGGTLQDNMADKIAKGRQASAHGEAGGLAKLKDDDVRTIRARWAAGEPQTAIAPDYAVSQATIGHIVHRKTWQHI